MKLNHHRAGAGEPLVLMHGIGMSWRAWTPVLPGLVAERDVIALDLPGFGASRMPPAGTSPGISSLTALVADFLDELGLERPHVAGNSLGGWISLELAKLGRVASATAISPAGFHTAAESFFQRASLWATYRGARVLGPALGPVAASPLGRALAGGQYFRRPRQLSPAAFAEVLRTVAQAPWFNQTRRAITAARFEGGEQIRVPVTIAWGDHDRLLLPRQAPRALRAIPGARGVTLRGCGHVPMSDDPEQVTRVILDGTKAERQESSRG